MVVAPASSGGGGGGGGIIHQGTFLNVVKNIFPDQSIYKILFFLFFFFLFFFLNFKYRYL